MSEKSRRNYPFIGRIYTAEQIDNMIGGLDPSNYYNKDDIDSMLDIIETTIDAKQDELTAGDNVTIENNVISAVGGNSDWVLADDNTIKSCFTINTDGCIECVKDILFIMKGSVNDTKYLGGNSAFIPKGFVAKTSANQYTAYATCESTVVSNSGYISVRKVYITKDNNNQPAIGSIDYRISFAIDNNAIVISKTLDIQTRLGFYGYVAYVKN